MIGLYKNLNWHATNLQEKNQICEILNVNSKAIHVATNLTIKDINVNNSNFHSRNIPLRICFISRITKKKNLDYALQIIDQVKRPVIFNIYGTNDQDITYWKECNFLIQNINKLHKVKYFGKLHPSKVLDTFREHDLFLFPTHGENFGHVIFESISVGTPVLITDKTPWKGMENKGAGWDLPIEDTQAFINKIEWLCDLKQECYQELRKSTLSYAKSVFSNSQDVSASKCMFQECQTGV